MYLIVAYDVVIDKHRRRLQKRLKCFLEHVQKSVFEGELADSRYAELLTAIRRSVDLETDTVRVYHLCARCRPMTEVIGTGIFVETDDADVIV